MLGEREREKKKKKTKEEKRRKHDTKCQLFKRLSGISQPYRIPSSVRSPAWCPDTYSLSVQTLCLRHLFLLTQGLSGCFPTFSPFSFHMPMGIVSLSLSLFFFFLL